MQTDVMGNSVKKPAIIKANQTAAHQPVVLDLADAASQADRLIESAQRQAQKIVARAYAQADRIIRQASQRQVGQTPADPSSPAGKDDAPKADPSLATSSSDLEQAWLAALDKLESACRQQQKQLANEAVQLAISLAKRVIHQAVQTDAQVIVRQLAAALEHLLDSGPLAVHIHPDDRPAVTTALPRLITRFSQLRHMELVDDPAVARGGCVIHHGAGDGAIGQADRGGVGRIDATLQKQIDRLIAALLASGGEVSP